MRCDALNLLRFSLDRRIYSKRVVQLCFLGSSLAPPSKAEEVDDMITLAEMERIRSSSEPCSAGYHKPIPLTHATLQLHDQLNQPFPCSEPNMSPKLRLLADASLLRSPPHTMPPTQTQSCPSNKSDDVRYRRFHLSFAKIKLAVVADLLIGIQEYVNKKVCCRLRKRDAQLQRVLNDMREASKCCELNSRGEDDWGRVLSIAIRELSGQTISITMNRGPYQFPSHHHDFQR